MLQRVVDALEGGPVRGTPLPALPHQIVDFRGTPVRLLHAIARLQLVEHVGQVDARIRRVTVRGYLPEQDAKGPHIRFGAAGEGGGVG